MRLSLPWACASLFAIGFAGCVRLDEDHCANQDEPRGYCDELHEVAYCSSCEAENNGCTAKRPSDMCDPVGGVAETGATTTTDVSMTASMSTTESMDSSTTEDIEPGCGNGVRDLKLDENCDTDDIPAMDCNDVGLMPGDTDGSVGCYPQDHPLECTYDLTGCDGAAVCGNGIIEGTEQCDMGMLADQTCESLSDLFIGGELTCTGPKEPNPCTFNTSQCEQCLGMGVACETNEQCCSPLPCGALSDQCGIL